MYCISLGPQPVNFQCPLTFSLGEFPGYWDWIRYPGLPPMLEFIAFSPFAFHVFSIHSSPAIGFNSCCFFYDQCICTHSIDPSLAHGEFLGSGTPDVVVPEAEHGVHMKQKSHFKFLPWSGF